MSTCLWFDSQAEQAANFYVEVFKGIGKSAKIKKVVHYNKASAKASGQPEGSVLTVAFELDGQEFMALDGGPVFKFTPAISLVVNCGTQGEIDYFWDKLSQGGKTGQCGWIDYDKFGISWQVVPGNLEKLMTQTDPQKYEAVTDALMHMTKLDIKALEQAVK